MRFRVVLFDLDGTLIDSGAMILSSFRHATRSVLREELADEQLRAAVAVGAGLTEQMSHFGPEHVDALVRAYRAHNAPLHDELVACGGVLELLPRLKREGRRLGVVTAKRRVTVELAFGVLPLERWLDVVVTAEDTVRHKPDPAPVLLALERLGVAPGDAAFVGDSPYDVQAAKAAGVRAIAVTWGGLHDAARLAAAHPDALVDSAEELLRAL
jgi:pyrophosphatase PpaX